MKTAIVIGFGRVNVEDVNGRLPNELTLTGHEERGGRMVEYVSYRFTFNRDHDRYEPIKNR